LHAELIIVPWLGSGMHPQAALEELRAYRSQGSVMLVATSPTSASLPHICSACPELGDRHSQSSLTLLELDVFRAGAARLLLHSMQTDVTPHLIRSTDFARDAARFILDQGRPHFPRAAFSGSG